MIASGLVLAFALRAAPPAAVPDVGDLPLVEVRSPHEGRRLAVMLTGDGGWAGLDRALGKTFTDAGVSVVALSSPRYLWKRRTPEEAAAAVARIIAHYRGAWGCTEFLLVGYSRGADLVPFVAARLPKPVSDVVALVAMLGPGTFAEFEFHPVDLMRSFRRGAAMSTERAVRSIGGASKVLCVQGSREEDSLCPKLVDLPWVTRVVLPGRHHFDGDYQNLARIVLDAARAAASRALPERRSIEEGSGT